VKEFVSGYELIQASQKTINGKNFAQGKFSFETARKKNSRKKNFHCTEKKQL
jgi:hypothetical protein